MEVTYEKDGVAIPLAIPFQRAEKALVIEYPVTVRGRLTSTRAGNNANWHGGNIPLSGAPYQPRVDLTFEAPCVLMPLGWHEHAGCQVECDETALYLGDREGRRFHNVPPLGLAQPWLSWGGTLCDAPCLIVGTRVIDNSQRAFRQALFADLEPLDVGAHQGHLTVTPVRFAPLYAHPMHTDLLELPGDIFPWESIVRYTGVAPKMPQRPVELYNHAALPVWAAWGLDNKRLLVIAPQHTCVITSPDHVLEPVHIPNRTDARIQLVLMEHPIPDGRD